MIFFKKSKDLSKYLTNEKLKTTIVGFVPTMGALHQGHLSLIESSKKEAGITICSIFINPTQFNNTDDFAKYPIAIEKDIELLLSLGCDVLFLPSKEEIYPAGYLAKHFEVGKLEMILEGHFRPGHFQGVCQVVDRLLEIIIPDRLYLGAKDYQQCKVIDKLIHLTNKQHTTQLIISPTVREEDGLAMSSRNLRLNSAQRKLAPALHEALKYVQENFDTKSVSQLKKEAIEELEAKGFKVDYLEIADAETLIPSEFNSGKQIALVAAYLDKIRLIDNLLLR